MFQVGWGLQSLSGREEKKDRRLTMTGALSKKRESPKSAPKNQQLISPIQDVSTNHMRLLQKEKGGANKSELRKRKHHPHQNAPKKGADPSQKGTRQSSKLSQTKKTTGLTTARRQKRKEDENPQLVMYLSRSTYNSSYAGGPSFESGAEVSSAPRAKYG